MPKRIDWESESNWIEMPDDGNDWRMVKALANGKEIQFIQIGNDVIFYPDLLVTNEEISGQNGISPKHRRNKKRPTSSQE